MNNIQLTSQELESINGGYALEWGAGFLEGLAPVPVLGALVGFGAWLGSGYSSYVKGVNDGFNAFQ